MLPAHCEISGVIDAGEKKQGAGNGGEQGEYLQLRIGKQFANADAKVNQREKPDPFVGVMAVLK